MSIFNNDLRQAVSGEGGRGGRWRRRRSRVLTKIVEALKNYIVAGTVESITIYHGAVLKIRM